VLDRAARFIDESPRVHNTWQRNQVTLSPSSQTELKKHRKIMRLQDAKKSSEAYRNQLLQEIRDKNILMLNEE
jgi:hypothetical protein